MSLRILFLLLAVAMLTPTLALAAGFDDFFTDQTMRVDYFHSGTVHEEHISLDRAVLDGPWPGSRTRLVDTSNLGKYLFEVTDRDTNVVLYSRGFASVYGEWETTPEAQSVWRTFHESLRFPWPKKPVQISLKRRDSADDPFREIWTTTIDPASRAVVKAALAPQGAVWVIFENGAPAEKVDLVILGDGYTAAEMEKFHADAKRLVDRLFTEEPFKSRKADFNVRAIDLPAAESGVSRPHAGIYHRSPLSTHYSAFDSERYVLTYDNRRLRDVASAAPYDFLAILVNDRTYGGGGIFGDQETCAADTAYAGYIFVHEFGHHFAGLGDEYFTSDVAYETGAARHPEPWEPNVTALADPARLKWKDLVTPGTPIPTPWPKAEYEKASAAYQEERRKLRAANAPEEEMEKLFQREQQLETELLGKAEYAGRVGAFEGASYESKGLYRPMIDCIMFSRNKVGFCAVCRRAIERAIDMYSRP
jgi:hypothetical protein